MPLGNGTGPMGMGPMTGRGMGFCAVPAYGAGAGAPYSYTGMGYPYGATAPYGYAGTGYSYRVYYRTQEGKEVILCSNLQVTGCKKSEDCSLWLVIFCDLC